MKGPAATSALKAAHFGDWPEERFLHLTIADSHWLALSDSQGRRKRIRYNAHELTEHILELFAPELILYRPVAEYPHLHEAAKALLQRSDVPLALWLMDDWPARLSHQSPDVGAKMHAELLALTERSSLNLAISDRMAACFAERYKAPFQVARNVVWENDWPTQAQHHTGEIKLRYSGSLAPDMSLDAVRQIARFVASPRGGELRLTFEIRTQEHWFHRFAAEFDGLDRVSCKPALASPGDYRAFLQGADIVVMAYNQDSETERYLQYSFANKAPEALASGQATFVFGPASIETVAFLSSLGASSIAQNTSEMQAELTRLAQSPEERQSLGKRGRREAFRLFDAKDRRDEMRQWLARAAAAQEPPSDAPTTAILSVREKVSIVRRLKTAIGRTQAWLKTQGL